MNPLWIHHCNVSHDILAEFAEALANPLEYLSKIERNEAMLAILEDFEGQVNIFAL